MKALGWLFMFQTGLALLGFASGDPVASRIIVTGEVLVLGGAVLAVGGPVAFGIQMDASGASQGVPGGRLAHLATASAWVLPPSVGFLGMGRLLGSLPEGTIGVSMRIVICLAALGVGWILQWIDNRAASIQKYSATGVRVAWTAIPLGLAITSFLLGVAGLVLFGWFGLGGESGLVWAGIVAAAALLGWVLRRVVTSPRPGRLIGRLTTTQRVMDRMAETGLGIGEIVVQVPVVLGRTLGVVVWRGIGDFVVDTLLLGSAVKTVEGIGTALRYVQNGRIQRYTLVVVLAAVLLLFIMMR
jgi:hypothetical protein